MLNKKLMNIYFTRAVAAACLVAAVVATPASAGHFGGAVFVGTNHNNTNVDINDPEPANQVAMFNRSRDGTLELVGYFPTGGQGSGPAVRFAGDGLGSAKSLVLARNNRFLLVANAGSDTISVMRVRRNGLTLVDVEPTGDGSTAMRFPNSIAVHRRLVYVLNSAGNASITGFFLSGRGTLTPIPGSTRFLDANQLRYPPDPLLNPTQVSFTPDGSQLVVIIKDGPVEGALPDGTVPSGPGRILVFNMRHDGRPSENFVRTDTNNEGPFGFSFDRRGNLLTALFIGGPGLSSAAGSFRINNDGTLTGITPNVDAAGEIDLCWLENNGRFA